MVVNNIKEFYDGLNWREILRNSSKIEPYILNFFIDKEKEKIKEVISKYPFRVNPYYASLIKERGDPIWLQSIPDIRELDEVSYLKANPLQETGELYHPTKNLIHRYPQKALILASNICPTYCRHCFRNYFVGHEEFFDTSSLKNIIDAIEYIDLFNRNVDGTPESFDKLSKILKGNTKVKLFSTYLERHKENAKTCLEIGSYKIRDVLLSGGDPLSLSDERLDVILERLNEVYGLEIMRIGTRFPVLLPQRFDDNLIKILKKYSDKPLYLNTHFNHPFEITKESSEACNKLADAGIIVRNQTVLLKDVNDDVKIMKNLFEELLKIRVAPYYLYQTMMAEGTEHLRVPVWKGLHIMSKLRGNITGFGIPDHIISAPGGRGKVPLLEGLVYYDLNKGLVKIKNYEGNIYDFQDPLNYPKPDKKIIEELLESPTYGHLIKVK